VRLRGAGALASILVVAACSSGSSAPKGAAPGGSSAATPRSTTSIGTTPRPRDTLDGERMLGAFLAATYTPRAAGGWYRGAGATSVAGDKVTYEVWVRASTPAQALAFCPPVANAAAYFLGSATSRLTLSGRIDVPLEGGVTFKDAAFSPVTCATTPSASDPVRATMPADAAAATIRLRAFLDDYFRQAGDWFGFASHDVDAKGVPRIEISISDAPGRAAARCATLRPLIAWFLGSFHAQVRVQPRGGAGVTC
jgi:hypothetical protein